VRAVVDAVRVVVVVAAEDDVDEVAAAGLGELVVVWLALVGDADDDFGALRLQLGHQLLGCC
jgi:hypothetical protein